MADCTAIRHTPIMYSYRRLGCRCPETVAAARAKWRSRYPAGRRRKATKARDPHVDLIAVERAMRGDDITLTIRERGEVIRRLTQLGLSARQIAARLKVADRTVTRYRSGRVQSAQAAA